jgi:hypothetical protein
LIHRHTFYIFATGGFTPWVAAVMTVLGLSKEAWDREKKKFNDSGK